MELVLNIRAVTDIIHAYKIDRSDRLYRQSKTLHHGQELVEFELVWSRFRGVIDVLLCALLITEMCS